MADDPNTHESEEWRDIPSWPGYQASNQGRIRSLKRTLTPKVMTPRADPRTGYLRIALRSFPHRKTVKVHRLICEAFHGPSPLGKSEVAHGDGTRTNNHCNNLRWASRQENVADQISHGTFKFPRNRRRRLTSEETIHAAKMKASGHSSAEIAKLYGVHEATINRMLKKAL